MDRPSVFGNSDSTDLEMAANDASSSQADAGAYRIPGRREIIEIELTRGTATGLFDFVLQNGAKATVTTDELLGFELPVIPGMVADVDVRTGEKTVLGYLMKPLTRMQQSALRER